MLHDAQLDKSFWSYALAVATYVGNRTVHARLSYQTAVEAFTGKKRVVSHLRQLGSVAYAHVEAKRRPHRLLERLQLPRLVESIKKVVATRHATFGRLEGPELDAVVDLPPSDALPPSPPPTPYTGKPEQAHINKPEHRVPALPPPPPSGKN
jgi:hypothetical protein